MTTSTAAHLTVTTDHRPAGAAAPKGPASYFPSIEKTYGRPVAHWVECVRARHAGGTVKHGELVTWLKTEHRLGHGHANAVVAYTLGLLRSGS